jgi:short chain dehydrogenase
MTDSGAEKMLKGRTAIVTGSTSGIGLGIAGALAGAGAGVMLNGFGDPAQIEEIRRSLAGRHGVRVAYSGADMSKPAEVRRMVSRRSRNSVLSTSWSTTPASSTSRASTNSPTTGGTRSSPSIFRRRSTRSRRRFRG